MIGVKYVIGLDLVKREAGASPARTRRCNVGVLLQDVTGCWPGRRSKMMIAKSEDLPMMGTVGPRVIG